MRPTRITRIMGTRDWWIGVAMAGAITILAALITAPRIEHGATAAPEPAPGRPSPPLASGAERFVIDPAVSTVAYRVGETALSQNRFHIATGVTNAIQGNVDVDLTHPQMARIGMVTVDLSQLRSDSARRDSALRTRWLESAKYPTAAFTPIAIEGLPDTYTGGRVVPVRVTGFLTGAHGPATGHVRRNRRCRGGDAHQRAQHHGPDDGLRLRAAIAPRGLQG